MKTLEQITETLESLSDNDLFDLWNEYTENTHQDGDRVHNFDDEFFEVYFTNPQEAARAAYFGKIDSWSNKYIMFNGYGNLESSNYLSDMISISDLANYIEDNQGEYKSILG